MVMKHICKSGKETGDSSACLLEEAANGRFFEMWKCRAKGNATVNLFLLHSKTWKGITEEQ